MNSTLKDELDLIDKKKTTSFSLLRIFIIISSGLLIFFLIFSNFSVENENLATINKLNDILAEKENKIEQYDGTIAELDKEFASIKDELIESQNELIVFKKYHKDEISDYIGQIGELEKEVQSLKDKLDTTQFLLSQYSNNTEETLSENVHPSQKINLTSEKSVTPSGSQFKFIPYDEPPTPTTPIRPRYPNLAQEAGIEGQVIVQCFVDKKGKVTKTIVVKGIPKTGLDEAAVIAIERTRFNPAKQRNKPVGVWITIPINFKLQN